MTELLDSLNRPLLQVDRTQLVVAAEEVVVSCRVALTSLILHNFIVLNFNSIWHANYALQSHRAFDVVEEKLENVQRAVSYSNYLLISLAENDLLKLGAHEDYFFALRLLTYLFDIVHRVYCVPVVDVYDLQLSRFSQFHHELRTFQVLNVQVLVSNTRTEVRLTGYLVDFNSKPDRRKWLFELTFVYHGLGHFVGVQSSPRRHRVYRDTIKRKKHYFFGKI